MSAKWMFPRFLSYVFLFNGLPVYYSHQTPSSAFYWYVWRVVIVMKYNFDLALHIYLMVTDWYFPYSLFGFIDVSVSAFIVNSLIGKRRKLIELQRTITTDFNKKGSEMTAADKQKMRALQAVFGLSLFISIAFLGYSMHRFVKLELPTKLQAKFNWYYIFFVSVTNWLNTAANTLFYCVFCKHLKAMFLSINKKVERLGIMTLRQDTAVTAVSDYPLEKPVRSVPCDDTVDGGSSIYPVSVSLWSKHSLNANAALSLPLLSRSRKSFSSLNASLNRKKRHRRFSCSFIGSRHYPKTPTTFKDDKRDVKQNRYNLARKIQRLNQKFSSVSLLVRETDNVFSLQVLTILSITFLRTCSYIYMYISSDWRQIDCCATVSIVQQIFFDFLAFGSIAMEASLVAEEAKKFSSLIVLVDEIYKSKSMKVQIQCDVAQLTVYSFDVQLTAWKFFTVSRRFVPTVIGVTATYILIILQLHQIVPDTRCNEIGNVTNYEFFNGTETLKLY